MNDLQFAFRQSVKDSGFTVVAALTLVLGIVTNPTAHGAERSQTFEWTTGSPEEVGLDSTALNEMFDYVHKQKVSVHSVQIARHGKLVLDAYFYPYNSEMRHDVASVTKSVTSTLIGLAIQKGFIRDVQQPVLSFFPNRAVANSDENKQKLAVEHLLTMQAGWDCGFEPKEARLFEMRRSADWLQFMLDLPMVAEPGTRFAYCSGNPHMLSIILSQVTGTNALAFARRELFEPLSIRDVAWPADPRGNTHGWGDLQMHPRDMAKLGQLFLQHGRWDQRQILSEAWLGAATRAQVGRTTNRDHYGYLWWVKGDDYPGMFEAVGRGGQRINVWPAKDLVLVFTGSEFEPGDLAKFILKALKSDGPLRANREASVQLAERIAFAARLPAAQPVAKLPAIAGNISGKTFKLSTNTVGLGALSLSFNDSAEAQAELLWNGRSVPVRLGLDGVERFSINPLVGLPQASKGQWINGETFLLHLDLVGAINDYQLNLTFSDGGKSLKASLTERTGLNDEQFEGTLSR
ncbi:MAG: beta-lactamase family protein [Verrucomicrobiales bacterium]|nr:beta-lactamase family protein [Verrucomicrobiales bacterium]